MIPPTKGEMFLGYFHSVTLNRDLCRGCTTCIKRCPTEAIRVRDGRASIIEDRCIDCGECIRVCPNHAKAALTDSLCNLPSFAIRIALPSPSLMAQFKSGVTPGMILGGLLELGFDRVYEVALAAEAVTYAIRTYLKGRSFNRPLISSACPAVARLIQVRFPSLAGQIIPLEAPIEIAARLAKEEISAETGIPISEIGAFFITPCPAKVTAIKQPLGRRKSYVDGAVSIAEVYGALVRRAESMPDRGDLQKSTGLGLGWGRAGGENLAIGFGSLLGVDGISHVVGVLEEIERGKLGDVDYVEGLACPGGCIGGPLSAENPFVARVRLRKLSSAMADRRSAVTGAQVAKMARQGYLDLTEPILPRPALRLDPDITTAINKMEALEKQVQELPGLDCGSCGAPTCRALAEDMVQGLAQDTDCVFKLRERVQSLAETMVELAGMLPPSMPKRAQGGKGKLHEVK